MRTRAFVAAVVFVVACSGGGGPQVPNVTGTWVGPVDCGGAGPSTLNAVLEEAGGAVSGTVTFFSSGGNSGPHGVEGTWNGTTLTVANQLIPLTLTGTVVGTYWSGTYLSGATSCPFEATINGAPFPTPSPTPTPEGEIFVTVPGNTSLRVFARGADGDAVPLRTITGGNTTFDYPTDVEVDVTSQELVVANNGNSAITVHPLGASGNIAPSRRIVGPGTGLAFHPSGATAGLFVDSANGEIGAANAAATSPSITVHARTADGDVAPLRVLQGAATLLVSPRDIEVDTVNGELFVGDCGGGASSVPARILVFSRTATGDVAPIRWFHFLHSTGEGGGIPYSCMQASGSGFNVSLGIDAANGEIVVTSVAGGTRVYARTAGSPAGGDPTPLRVVSQITGNAVYVDAVNAELGVTRTGTAGGGRFDVFSTAGGASLRFVEGASTGMSTPGFGIAVRP